jgi:hypothetical protein
LVTLPGRDHGATIRDCRDVIPLVQHMIKSHPCEYACG